KLLKKFFKKQQKEVGDTWDCGDEKPFHENRSSLSTNKEEKFLISSLLIKSKNQFQIEVFKAIYEKEYIVFTRYEDFEDCLTRNNIVSSSL
ncbi:10265_t:CDS:1, partial [Dentiscutata heterogama]